MVSVSRESDAVDRPTWELSMNENLWSLCQREALLALRDQARKEERAGNPQAAHVVIWLDRILKARANDAGAQHGPVSVRRPSAGPPPLRFHHHALQPMRRQ